MARTPQQIIRGAAVVAALTGAGVAAAVASGATPGAVAPAKTGTNGYQTINIPPPPVKGPAGKAQISRLVVTHKGVEVTASCAGSENAVCVLTFQLSGGVSEGLAAGMTRTMIVGTHTFDLTLNANAQAKLNEYRYFYAYLKVLQTNGSKTKVLVGRSFEMTAG